MTHLKTIKIKNPRNTILQVPRAISDLWGLKEGDSIDMNVDDATGNLILIPKRGYLNVTKPDTLQDGSPVDSEG